MNNDNTLFEEEAAVEEMPTDEIEVAEVSEPDFESGMAEPETDDTESEIVEPETDVTESEPTEAATEEVTSEAISSEEALSPESKVVPYHERYYLKYREGKRNTPLDIEGTRNFLKEIGFDGGELRQAREGKEVAARLRNSEQGKANQLYCSYCGAEIAGVEFYRLPDGRTRCNTCSSTVVRSKAEVVEICQRVVSNLENFFGATIEAPVSIEVVDERKLKKKVGVPLDSPDAQSMLILGVAINKKGKYSIILENGAPRISLIATFAHELTHIWQYTHWDNKKNFKPCPKDKRLLIYEGLAKWVEIQYLYLVGETTVARREEYVTRNRQDEYGVGFCLYEDRYPLSREVMSCEETPFTLNGYPLD